MKFLSCLALLTIISCGSGEVKKNTDDVAYQTSGVEQFFMTELPAWANGSSEGQCFKSTSYTYLDYSKLTKSYQLNYQQMAELQAQYNDRLESYFRSTSVRFLKPVEQASFFSNSLEQVRAGTRQLKIPPQVKDVDVIWLEGFIQAGKQDEIKKMAEAGKFDERLPIIFSSCLSHQGLNQWLSENNLEQVGFYLLSAEWLNPFGSDLALKPGAQLELKKLVTQDVKFNLITPDPKYQTNELKLQ
jgi:hypothetical protein